MMLFAAFFVSPPTLRSATPGAPVSPAGYVLLVDDDGAYLTDADGAYLLAEQ